MSFFKSVYEAVKLIPKGRVATYGDIARYVGSPRAARVVGYALHVNPEPNAIPCHRVVNREGRLAPSFAFGGMEVQKALLEAENVEVRMMDTWTWQSMASSLPDLPKSVFLCYNSFYIYCYQFGVLPDGRK